MKVVFIIPYYGTFPNYFNLFLKTCENNPGYEWFIFSEDNGKYNYLILGDADVVSITY